MSVFALERKGGGRTTAPGVAILGGMRPARERRAAVGSMLGVDGGVVGGEGGGVCPDIYGGRGRRGSGRLFPQIAASGAACAGLGRWAAESGLMAQFDYNLCRGDYKLIRNYSCPDYSVPNHHGGGRRRAFGGKSWTRSLITIGPLFTLERKNKSPQTHFSPLRLPRLLYPPATMSPPADGKLGKGESGTARILGSGASGQSVSIDAHEYLSMNTYP